MNEVEAAWLAGLFEGEGNFRKHTGAAGRSYVYLALAITSTDRDVLERVVRITGIGRVREEKANGKLGAKASYRWYCCHRAHVREVVEAIRPHLGLRRSARLAELEGMLTAELHPNAPKPAGNKGKYLSDS